MDVQIAERLQKFRKENGYSQEQLAEELGVSRQAVSKWERGEASPDTENLIALAKLYNLSLDDLLFEKPAAQATKPPVEEEKQDGEKAEGEEEKEQRSHMDTAEGVVAGVTVLISCMVYFLLGGVWGLWHPGWIVFLAIPIMPTIAGAIEKKDPHVFCFPVLVVAVYLLLGCQWGLWHPWWLIFLTIPVYYLIADFFKKK